MRVFDRVWFRVGEVWGDQPKSPQTAPGPPMWLFCIRERFWPMAGGRPWSNGVNKNLRKRKNNASGGKLFKNPFSKF